MHSKYPEVSKTPRWVPFLYSMQLVCFGQYFLKHNMVHSTQNTTEIIIPLDSIVYNKTFAAVQTYVTPGETNFLHLQWMLSAESEAISFGLQAVPNEWLHLAAAHYIIPVLAHYHK